MITTESARTDGSTEPAAMLEFTCNICGSAQRSGADLLRQPEARETPTCDRCQSWLRVRAVIHVLSLELFGESLPLPAWPARPDLRGIGLSDWETYARRLAARLSYENTYYHQEPRLDITSVPASRDNTCDFVISTEVFEHVPPPVQRAFDNSYRLLKPGGVLVLTVPWTLEADTREHFPDLFDWQLIARDGRKVLRNQTRDGREQWFDNLVFHGGDGQALELRQFSRDALIRHLQQAGFEQIRVRDEPWLPFGISWGFSWSLPITARKPR
jgi:SAM-dependent methyltransferase